MGKVGETFGLPNAPHVQSTSTGTADVKTINPPAGAVACILTVETNAARITLDGSTPSVTNGVLLPAGAVPFLLPLAETIKFVSAIAAASIVNVVWLN